MVDPVPYFIGYDAREVIAADVLRHSLKRLTTWPLHISYLNQSYLREAGLYRRTHTEQGGVRYDDIDGRPFSTDFTFTRFLVPALCQWQGWAIFSDCDMLFRADPRELIELRDERYAVQVVQHKHEPTEKEKMDGQVQALYKRKNWSSLILWNCEHPANRYCGVQTVNVEQGRWLHAFSWLKDEEIGALPEEWNWLEGWSSPEIEPKNVHYTRGGPWFEDYKNVQYADEWLAEKATMEANEAA